jgi:hypothetical protein
MIGFRDSNGQLYRGDKSYRLHLPAPVPVANFWSLTLYDALTVQGTTVRRHKVRRTRGSFRARPSVGTP